MRPQGREPVPIEYREHGRGYTSTFALLAVLVAGFVLDQVLSGLGAHWVAWLVAAVVIIGIDALTIRAARTYRSVIVTRDEVIVGRARVSRADIIGLDHEPDPRAPVLGSDAPAAGLPRGVTGLSLHLAGSSRVVVPTRMPERLAAVLDAARDLPDVRLAGPDDVPLLAEVGQKATQLFAVAGFELPGNWGSIAAMHEPLAVLVSGRPPTGFVRLGEADGCALIELVAVVPSKMRNGVGRALVEAACIWGVVRGYSGVLVSTYRDVPWNAPFFESCGFSVLAEPGPEMKELQDWERAVGLDRLGPRVTLKREL
jgi:GNAT superfamily N-acetyltransferase